MAELFTGDNVRQQMSQRFSLVTFSGIFSNEGSFAELMSRKLGAVSDMLIRFQESIRYDKKTAAAYVVVAQERIQPFIICNTTRIKRDSGDIYLYN